MLVDRLTVSPGWPHAHCGRGRDCLSRIWRGHLRNSRARRSACKTNALCSALRVQDLQSSVMKSQSRDCFPSTILTARGPRCQGFGNTIDFDLDLVIPDKTKSLGEGAIEPWTKPKYRPLFTELKADMPSRRTFRWMCRGSSLRKSSVSAYSTAKVSSWACVDFSLISSARNTAARPRISEPLSWLFALLGMQRQPTTAGSAAGQDSGPQYL